MANGGQLTERMVDFPLPTASATMDRPMYCAGGSRIRQPCRFPAHYGMSPPPPPSLPAGTAMFCSPPPAPRCGGGGGPSGRGRTPSKASTLDHCEKAELLRRMKLHPGFVKHRSVEHHKVAAAAAGCGGGLRSSSASSNGGFRSLSSDSRISLFCDANCDDTPLQMSSIDGVTAQVILVCSV